MLSNQRASIIIYNYDDNTLVAKARLISPMITVILAQNSNVKMSHDMCTCCWRPVSDRDRRGGFDVSMLLYLVLVSWKLDWHNNSS